MFSQTAEYALRAVVSLADSDGRPLTTQQLAETTQVPLDYLSKVMQALGRLADVIEQGKPDEAERFWREYMEKSGRVLASSGLGSRVILLHDA